MHICYRNSSTFPTPSLATQIALTLGPVSSQMGLILNFIQARSRIR